MISGRKKNKTVKRIKKNNSDGGPLDELTFELFT